MPVLLRAPFSLRAGRAVLVLLALGAVTVGSAAWWLGSVITPSRVASGLTPASFLIDYEEVSFHSLDGVPLAGWFVAGRRGAPTLILAHDLGQDRSHLLNIAVPLQKAGYNIFLPDLRGHGRSGGQCSLGVLEKRDVLAALDYLVTRPDLDRRRFGFLGVRMGAQAGALAALDRPELRALVLDSPYAGVRSFLGGRLSSDERVRRVLLPLPLLLYRLRFRIEPDRESASGAVRLLGDRNLLFISTRTDEAASAVRSLYDSVPEGRNTDKNLLELSGSSAGPLYAADKVAYDDKLLHFFQDYLPIVPDRPNPVAGAAQSAAASQQGTVPRSAASKAPHA